jgi:hypothetical protein
MIDLFAETEARISSLLAELEKIDGARPDYARKVAMAFFLGKAFKTDRAE